MTVATALLVAGGCAAEVSDVAGVNDSEKSTPPREWLSPRGRSTVLEALEDIRAFVQMDPLSLKYEGEYCGLVVRAGSNGGYYAFRYRRADGDDQTYCEVFFEVAPAEYVVGMWHTHYMVSDYLWQAEIPPSFSDIIAHLAFAKRTGRNHSQYRYSWVFTPRNPMLVYRIRSVKEAFMPTALHHGIGDALFRIRHLQLYPSRYFDVHSARLVILKELSVAGGGRWASLPDGARREMAAAGVKAHMVNELSTGVVVDFSRNGGRMWNMWDEE